MGEPVSQLKSEIERQKEIICSLEFKAQEVTNESLLQQQSLRRRILELERQLGPEDGVE